MKKIIRFLLDGVRLPQLGVPRFAMTGGVGLPRRVAPPPAALDAQHLRAGRNDDGGRLPRFARNDGRGFTLLELLIVIGIIGVLTALATVAYATTQVGGRNARRKQDLVAIQNALEQYYAENNFSYPDSVCADAATYLKGSWPIDPSSTVSTPKNYSATCVTNSYCVCGEMEGTATTRGNSGAGCDWSAVDKAYYCVGNLQ